MREEKEDAVHAASYEMGGGGEDEDTLFINLDQGEGEEFFRPPEVEDGEEEEPPDLLGQQGKLYCTYRGMGDTICSSVLTMGRGRSSSARRRWKTGRRRSRLTSLVNKVNYTAHRRAWG